MDHASSLHTPIFYCPMTRKSEEAYNLLWGNIVSIVGELHFSNNGLLNNVIYITNDDISKMDMCLLLI